MPLSPVPGGKRRRWPGWGAALALSMLLHAVVVALLVWRSPPAPHEEPEAVAVEVAQEPEAAKPPPKPEEVKPEPQPKVEPPKPEPPKIAPPKPEPPKVAPSKPEPPKVEPPKSPPAPSKAAPAKRLSRPQALHLGGHGTTGDGGHAGGPASPFDTTATQTIRDIMLTQVVRYWRPPAEVRGINAGVQIVVEVLPDGMLGSPLSAKQALDMTAAVHDYAKLDPLQQRVLYDLVQALRVAQPFSLPPEVLARAPFSVRLDFAFDQVP